MRAKIVRLQNRCVTFSVVAVLAIVSGRSATAAVNFSTFILGSDIASAEGQNSTIGITYAGNKFVGSVYFGPNNNQLYSTDLNGANVQQFGAPLVGAGNRPASGEVVVGASLGQAGFGQGDIYAGSEASTEIFRVSNNGSSTGLFATLPTGGDIRQIFFDPGSSFGGDMLVTTAAGDIYRVSSAAVVTLVASIGEDTEGMDIAPLGWGLHTGDLLVASEGSASLRWVSPAGVVTDTGIHVASAETVSFVPLNLGASGNPIEGFYVANYPVDVQKAGASQFTPYIGQAIITSEFGSNSPVWALDYNGGNLALSSLPIGFLPNQSEDGIFVTAERITDLSTPEPASLIVWSLLGLTIGGGTWWKRRRSE